MAIDELTAYLSAAKGVLDIFKGIKAELPDGPGKEKSQAEISKAEDALKAAEAQLAKEFGYHLCKCTFPPQIMLSTGRHQRHPDQEVFKCERCGNQEPPEAYFSELDKLKAHNEGLGEDASWITARY